MANLKVTLVKSTIGAVPKHKKTVEALGLKKLNKTVVLPDNAATRATVSALGAKVYNVISTLDKIEIMLYGNDGVTGIYKSV